MAKEEAAAAVRVVVVFGSVHTGPHGDVVAHWPDDVVELPAHEAAALLATGQVALAPVEVAPEATQAAAPTPKAAPRARKR